MRYTRSATDTVLSPSQSPGAIPGPNVAVTDFAASIVTSHAPLPVHAPVHSLNTKPASGVAARVTTLPTAKSKRHEVPHAIPPGALVTVPVPLPPVVTVRRRRSSFVSHNPPRPAAR